MMLLANIFGGFFSYQYKAIGLANDISDSLLAWAGSTAAIVQATTRITVGQLYDMFGFRKIFLILMLINIVNSAVCYHVKKIDWLFFICVQLNYLVLAGVFALFPAPASKTFGKRYGAQVYAIVLIATPLSGLVNTLFVKVLYSRIGNQNIIYIGTAASALAIVINYFFTEKLDTERLQRLGLLHWNRAQKPMIV